MIRLASARTRPLIDQRYFEQLIAKAILFRQTERIVSTRQFGGYRANIVTYTIARICHATQDRIDLAAIWRRQALSSALSSAIHDLCVPVQHTLTNPPSGANIGEYCKRPDAWGRVESIRWTVPDALTAELADPRAHRLPQATADRAAEDSPEMTRAALVPSVTWTNCAQWAKQTNQLQPWQRGLAHNLGQLHRSNHKQSQEGLKLLQEAVLAGFRPDPPLPPSVLEA